MDNSGGIQASLSGRYASALFDLACEGKALDNVEASLATLKAALADSDDFAALVHNRVLGRKDAAKIVAQLADTMDIDPLATRFVGVLAANGRLDQLGAIIRDFETLVARHRGEIAVDVTSAYPLDDRQLTEIGRQLKSRAGHEVKISTSVDPAILGGLVVRMGSQMIDSSIKTRLNTLSQAMKG